MANMRQSRPRRTDEDLRVVSERIYQSADQLVGLAEMLQAIEAKKIAGLEPRCARACLESLLFHARSLLKFFDDPFPRDDDAIVGDFFGPEDKWEPPAWSFAVDRYLENRVNKELAHITYALARDEGTERMLGGERGDPYYYGAIASAFRERMDAFAAQTPKHRLGEAWRRRPGT